jgi:vacuolar-type H+-ATPase subunit E/Vma4
MALDQLLAVLLDEAETEAKAILAAARTEAQAILDRSSAELDERRKRQQQELEAGSQRSIASALVTARGAARREELLARERLLARVVRAAADRFPEMAGNPQFRERLPGLVAPALECLGDRPGTIHCLPGLMEVIGPLLADRPGLKLAPDPAVGTGFRLTSDDGALVIYATLEDRVQRLDRLVRQEIVSRLGQAP